LFFSIGLFEDIKGTLSARLRLLVMLGAVAALLALNPDMLIKPVGVPVFDWFLENPWLATPIALLSLVFLPNAFNTADGANGLVAGISLITLLALGSADLGDLSLLLGLASISCLIFLVFNVMTAQFYLGDGGAYFLGALVGGALITASNTGVLPVWYLLSLIFYPSADFLWSICRRISRGQSPMASDELHLHNLVYARLRRLTGWQVGSNTMTGIGIAVVFAGLPYLAWLLASDRVEWLWVFLLQCLTYLGLWFLLRPKLAAKSIYC
jgi:UDP-N-acetylmuramyl pentapeptide phosphotransferase/UDP-N-acetylglucosamine-1-phosphate transferase